MMREDQQANHRSSDEVTEMTRALGNNGTAVLAELMRAGGAMGGAESAFGQGQAGAGNGEQGKALQALKYAEELLAEEAERLARQLRREVKKRVTDGMTVMLEEQTGVRERTSALQPKVKEGARQALAAVTALAKREERITTLAQELINVVEETEFGIALPAALAAVRDATESVQFSLAEGDASDDVVAAEKRIEADLTAMLEVVSEMSDANSRNRRQRGPVARGAAPRAESNHFRAENVEALAGSRAAEHAPTSTASGRRPRFRRRFANASRNWKAARKISATRRSVWPTSAAKKSPSRSESAERNPARSQPRFAMLKHRFGIVVLACAVLLVRGEQSVAQEEFGLDPLGEVIVDMQIAGGRLGKQLTDKPTQRKQKDAVDKLASLIQLLEEQRRRQGNGGGLPEKPLDESKIVAGPGGSGPLHAARRNGAAWGELPPHKRQQILQSMTEGFPAHYQQILERYYRRLADEAPATEAAEDVAPAAPAEPMPAEPAPKSTE